VPVRDQRLLAMRLKHAGREIPEIAKSAPLPYQLGDTDTFWVIDNNQTPPRQFQAQASLRYITDHSYWWVADGYDVSEADLQRSADQFETHTYPTNRAFFGSEWSPGVDSDVRLHIFMGEVPGVAGLFSASNSYSQLAEPYSNEREMFYINLGSLPPGNTYFDSVLAHEFQHMIHWAQDRNEDTWVNEGMSELASFINGYGASSFTNLLSSAPDTQLTGWADTPNEAVTNYGGSFRFMAYFLQRYGEEMTQAVITNPNNGIAGFNAVLAEHQQIERFDDVFADFVVANYLNDPQLNDGRWGYTDFTPDPVMVVEHYSVYPVENQTTVHQYGTDYLELSGTSPLTIEFSGAAQVKVVDNDAHSGQYQWYSLRGDDSNTRLTRAFDLRQVTSATLNYWTWYDIESDWDYGYVEASTDGGETWTILQTPHSATTNPSGNAYGPGYTGASGGGPPTWQEESLDLSAYAGQEILIRFEYVTDDAVNRPGWTLDDITIPELDFQDDVEAGPNNWQAEGFVRMDNLLPQRFLAQVLEIGDEVNLRRISLDEANHGALTIEGLGASLDRAVLLVSGLTPVTSQPADYSYKLSP
jgi:immune inhibitor A